MSPIPRSSITGTRTGARMLPRSRAPMRARRSRSRPPWVVGVSTGTVPYVFVPQPDAAAIPSPPAASAPGSPAAADVRDSAEPDDEPEDSRELGVRRDPLRPPVPRPVHGVTTTVDWQEFAINHFPMSPPPPPGGGIYIVRGAAAPLYVGQARSFAERWSKRLREAFQGGLIERNLADRKLRIWFGAISPNSSPEARKTLESVIIRTLVHGGLGKQLRNERSFHAFSTLAPLDVTHVLPLELARQLRSSNQARSSVRDVIQEVQTRNTLVIAAHNVFETGFYEVGTAR